MTKKIALLIGNERYADPNLTKLTVPASDVRALESVLKRSDISGFDQVDILLNPSMSEVMLAIGMLYANKTRDDLVLLYISGHGLVDVSGELYFALKDTQLGLPVGTALSAGFIKEAMNKSRSRRQVLILDACHSGAFERGAKGIGAPAITETTFETNGYGREILTSSSATQLSWEGDQVIGETDKSLFTHYLVEGLETGQAANQGEDQITVEQLYHYAHDQVVRARPGVNPQRWVDRQQGTFLIARNPRPVIKPRQLPNELKDALEDKRHYVREAAVRKELAPWLKSDDPSEVLAAEQMLAKLRKTERDFEVRKAVDEVLGIKPMTERVTEGIQKTESAKPSPIEQDKKIKPEPERSPVEGARLRPWRQSPTLPIGPTSNRPRQWIMAIAAAAGIIVVLVVAKMVIEFQSSEEHEKQLASEEPAKQLDQPVPETDPVDPGVNERAIAKKVNESAINKIAKLEAGKVDKIAKIEVDKVDKIAKIEVDKLSTKVNEYLKQAEQAIANKTLTTPSKENVKSVQKAGINYSNALQIDPLNKKARLGQKRITEQFLAWAEYSISQRQYDKVDSYLDMAALVDKDHPGISRLRKQMPVQNVATDSTTSKVFRDSLKDGSQGPVMVVIPTGSFEMGSPKSEHGHDANEEPLHTVKITRGFAMGKYEVTVGEFRKFIEHSGYRTEAERNNNGCTHNYSLTRNNDTNATWRDPGFSQSDNHPVVCVNWNEANQYIDWLNKQTHKSYRLPSEAEWEYAARAGTTTPFHFGETISIEQANYENDLFKTREDDDQSRTVAVGHFPSNAWGLHEVHGNVLEWVQGCWNDSYLGAPDDGSAWITGGCSLRLLRGGSWDHSPVHIRSATRNAVNAMIMENYVGFRLARDLD